MLSTLSAILALEYIIAFDANGADSVNVQSVVAKYDEDIRLPTEGFE